MTRRLIPAWAGKTADINQRSINKTAHPRVGGENQKSRLPRMFDAGSSPRGRGKRSRGCLRSWSWWLIPAWAGKTAVSSFTRTAMWAHPRVGGENFFAAFFGAGFSGSSPRGRGKLIKSCRDLTYSRLIPAWAGKTGG